MLLLLVVLVWLVFGLRFLRPVFSLALLLGGRWVVLPVRFVRWLWSGFWSACCPPRRWSVALPPRVSLRRVRSRVPSPRSVVVRPFRGRLRRPCRLGVPVARVVGLFPGRVPVWGPFGWVWLPSPSGWAFLRPRGGGCSASPPCPSLSVRCLFSFFFVALWVLWVLVFGR